ncbi:MAG: guanylate kinase [Bacilli bacterium]|jgi:guanylate kinase|nr:guanylate kinase [Bacilli bacterium]
MKKKGKLIIFSGPSGVGKSTVRQEVFKHPELNLKYSISMTTRAPREGEVNGVDYFFVTPAEFKKAIQNGELLEYAEFVGNYYGTPKAYVEKLLNQGYNVVLEIEVVGATQVMQAMDDYISIFLVPPTIEELENRIRNRRSEPEEIIQKRLNKAKVEMDLKNNYHFVVINTSIEQAEKEIVEIIKKAQEK